MPAVIVCYLKCIQYSNTSECLCSLSTVSAEHSAAARFRILSPPDKNKPFWTQVDFRHNRCANQMGESPLVQLAKFMNLIWDFPPDPMHVVYSGYITQIIQALWKGFRTCPGGTLKAERKCEIGQRMAECIRRLPFIFFARKPRLLFDLIRDIFIEYIVNNLI